MKKKIVIEIEEMITETRVVMPGNIICPACGLTLSAARFDVDTRMKKQIPKIETISIRAKKPAALEPEKE